MSQKRIRDFLRDCNRREASTIILTSHYMQDVQELAKRVIVIDKRSLVYEGTFETLVVDSGGGKQLRLQFGGDGPLPDLSAYGEVLGSEG